MPEKPIIDAFGQPRTPDGKPVQEAPTPTPPEPTKPADTTPKPESKAVGINMEDILALKDEIKQVKGSMGGNLAEQRKVIDRLKEDLRNEREGKKPSIDPLFKEVKRVKDLPKEEADAMTDAEKRLFDENADIKERMNGQHADAQKQRQEGENEARKREDAAEARKEADKAKAEFDKKAQGVARKLAGNDTELANKILDNFNLFRDVESLDDEGMEDRMNAAARMIPSYTPPKSSSPTGGNSGTAVKETTDSSTNIVDEAIRQATGIERGNYKL